MTEQQPGRLVLVRDDGSAADASRRDPQVGQIWTARPDRGAELEVEVLVAEVHHEYVQALLCGAECEWATDTDAVLEPVSTGLPRCILVHGDVSGSILKHRLTRAVGQVAPHIVERISLRGRGFDFNSSDLGRGTAIRDENDPRWEWKLQKHKQLRWLRARASELGWEIYKLGPRED
jgi:hypothetical protein